MINSASSEQEGSIPGKLKLSKRSWTRGIGREGLCYVGLRRKISVLALMTSLHSNT